MKRKNRFHSTKFICNIKLFTHNYCILNACHIFCELFQKYQIHITITNLKGNYDKKRGSVRDDHA